MPQSCAEPAECSNSLATPHNGFALRDCETALPCAYYALFLKHFIDIIVGISPTRPQRANCVALALWDPRRGEDCAGCTDFTSEEPSRCHGSCCCRTGPKACGRFREDARYLESIRRVGSISTYVYQLILETTGLHIYESQSCWTTLRLTSCITRCVLLPPNC